MHRHILKWKEHLFLNPWRFNPTYVRESGKDVAGRGSSIEAQCNARWEYLEADVKFFMHQIHGMSDRQLEELVIHELCHCIVAEMREKQVCHEERVVSHLVNVLWGLREYSLKEGRKQGALSKLRKRKKAR